MIDPPERRGAEGRRGLLEGAAPGSLEAAKGVGALEAKCRSRRATINTRVGSYLTLFLLGKPKFRHRPPIDLPRS